MEIDKYKFIMGVSYALLTISIVTYNSNRCFRAGHNVIINKLLNKELDSRYNLVMNSDVD